VWYAFVLFSVWLGTLRHSRPLPLIAILCLLRPTGLATHQTHTEPLPTSAIELSTSDQTHASTERPPALAPPPPPGGTPVAPIKRFTIGDRVLANVDDAWRPGTISQLDYREDRWALTKISPYQILVDSPCRCRRQYVYAPADDDGCVRVMPTDAQDLLELTCSGVVEPKCTDTGEECPRHHVCDDGLECGQYHFCGKKGRAKTRLRMKLLERQRAKERAVEPCADCQTTGCTDEWDASLDALLAFVDGPAADSGKLNVVRQPKKKAKNGKKRPKRSLSPQYVPVAMHPSHRYLCMHILSTVQYCTVQ
jgi:hypothetical protein